MKEITQEQTELLRDALSHYAKAQDDLINANYLEFDREQQVAEAQQILNRCSEIYPHFENSESIFYLNRSDILSILQFFNTADRINSSNTNQSEKSNYLMNIINTIRFYFREFF